MKLDAGALGLRQLGLVHDNLHLAPTPPTCKLQTIGKRVVADGLRGSIEYEVSAGAVKQ